MGTVELLIGIFKSARPIHWVKNFAVFAALTLSGTLFIKNYFIITFWAFLAFNLATSATYLLNDVLDIEKDRLHPIKKNRPIAKGTVPRELAILLAIGLACASLYLANYLSTLFFWAVATYLVVQIGYSLGLKKVAILDIILIAFGFVLRVYAGAFVINAHLSVWFLLTVISVALFLASGKRRAELSIATAGKTRDSLNTYRRELLNSYVTMFAASSWISWSLYTFFESPAADFNVWLFLAEISRATTISKLLMFTIPVSIFIIMRYEAVIFTDKSEAPERVLLKDKYLVGGIVLWTVMVLYILYGGVASI